jgi:hypothetical protein
MLEWMPSQLTAIAARTVSRLFPAQRIVEEQIDVARALRKAGAAPAGVQAIRTDARAERIEQHAMQVAAMDRELRPFVARIASGRLAVDELAEAVVETGFARGDRDLRQAAPRVRAGRARAWRAAAG